MVLVRSVCIEARSTKSKSSLPLLSKRRRAGLPLCAALAVLAILLTTVAHSAGFLCFPKGSGSKIFANSGKTFTGNLAWTSSRSPSLSAGALVADKQSYFEWLSCGIAAGVSWPLRYLRLGAITKEVAAEVKRKTQSTHSTTEVSSSAASQLKAFLPTYMKTHVIARTGAEEYRRHLNISLNVIVDAMYAEEPFPFEPYHKAVRGPDVDHYSWGNDFFRPMVKWRKSRVEGLAQVRRIKEALDAGDNVVLLANHQTEADPQVLSLLLESIGFEDVAERCIFLAGHKVTTDPLAIPFSMGRNLLTIFSKKYLNTFSAEEKQVKSDRNQKTVAEMQRLLSEGGNIFWVAPSGGRDRKDPATGRFTPAKFDPQSVGLFYLLAQKAARASKNAGHKTLFLPLAMWSHNLVPPPDDAQSAVGEARDVSRGPIAIEFGAEMDPEALGGRKKFPEEAERIVNEHYSHIDEMMRETKKDRFWSWIR